VLKIFIRRKGDLPIVAVLNDVMSDAGYNGPRPFLAWLLPLNIECQPKMP
jgi:hypothetical protein